jgi:hypothetical protein
MRPWNDVISRFLLLKVAAASVLTAGTPTVCGAVDLELRPARNTVAKGEIVELGLYAIANGGENEGISGLDVLLNWDPATLELQGNPLNNPAHPWLLAGFLDDQGADGMNTSLLDGNAMFQAVSSFGQPALATPEGFLITTFQFSALERSPLSEVRIAPAYGDYSRTQVLKFGAINENILGAMGGASIAIAESTQIWVSKITMLPGRTATVRTSGEIAGEATFGVTLLLEIAPRVGAGGTVTFTPSPPVDLTEAGDPWPNAGLFSAYDTDLASSVMRNGSISDNGTFVATPLLYFGPLLDCPVTASADSVGTWDVRFFEEGLQSGWEGIPTPQTIGSIRIVSLGDVDGNHEVDLSDFAEMEGCWQGPDDVSEAESEAALSCGVFDADGDGDIDLADFAEFGVVFGEHG